MKNQQLFSAKIGQEISIFIENRPGTLSSVIDTLREAGVNMLALSMSEGQDAGYVRIVADRVPAAVQALEGARHLLRVRDVVLIGQPARWHGGRHRPLGPRRHQHRLRVFGDRRGCGSQPDRGQGARRRAGDRRAAPRLIERPFSGPPPWRIRRKPGPARPGWWARTRAAPG